MTFFMSREATNTDKQITEPFNTKWASFCAALMWLLSLHRSILHGCRTALSYSDVLWPLRCMFRGSNKSYYHALWEFSLSSHLEKWMFLERATCFRLCFSNTINLSPCQAILTDETTVRLRQEIVKWCLNKGNISISSYTIWKSSRCSLDPVEKQSRSLNLMS